LFDKPPPRTWAAQTGLKLLLVVLAMEFAIRPIIRITGEKLNFSNKPWWELFQLSVVLCLSILLVVKIAKVQLSDLGLRPWREWSATEKNYFPQTLALAIAIFSFINLASLRLITKHSFAEIALFSLLPQLIWGFYQEFIYRGLLQSELVRRWGWLWGILVSNLIFTFGPLHAYHFLLARQNPGHLWIFAGIFSIGLYFGILYHRSGNLWVVGILHGVGDWFIDGIPKLLKTFL
jgi:membrane protease YdiL (CAAX protease family)